MQRPWGSEWINTRPRETEVGKEVEQNSLKRSFKSFEASGEGVGPGAPNDLTRTWGQPCSRALRSVPAPVSPHPLVGRGDEGDEGVEVSVGPRMPTQSSHRLSMKVKGPAGPRQYQEGCAWGYLLTLGEGVSTRNSERRKGGGGGREGGSSCPQQGHCRDGHSETTMK